MKETLIRIGIIVAFAAAGALGTQALIHWLPNTTTIAGTLALGYVGYLVTKK